MSSQASSLAVRAAARPRVSSPRACQAIYPAAARVLGNVLIIGHLRTGGMVSLCLWLAGRAGPGERPATGSRRHRCPGAWGGQGLGPGAGQRYLPVQAGQRKYPKDLVPVGDHVQAAAAAGRLPGRGGEHAQPGGVDEAHLAQVGDHRPARACQCGQALAESRRGDDIGFPGHGDD
jgi:hypothetical protein